jgi:hypothetical protein
MKNKKPVKKVYIDFIIDEEENNIVTLSFDMVHSKTNFMYDKFGLTTKDLTNFEPLTEKILYSCLDKEFKQKYDINKFTEMLDFITIEEIHEAINNLIMLAFPKMYQEEMDKIKKEKGISDKEETEKVEKK